MALVSALIEGLRAPFPLLLFDWLPSPQEKARAERIAAGLEAPPRERGGGRGRGRGRGGGPSDFSARGGRGRGGLGRGGCSGGAISGAGGEGGAEQGLRAQGETEVDAEKRAEGEPPAAKRLKMSEAGRDGGRDDINDDKIEEEDEEDDEDDGAPEEMAAKPPKGVDSPPSTSIEAEGEASSLTPPLGAQPADRPEQLDSNVPGSAAGQGEEGGGGGGGPAPKRFQVVCRHWRKGNCALGDADCPYLHHVCAPSIFGVAVSLFRMKSLA